MRLVKYSYDDTIYVLGTTLLDSQYYKKEELSDLYHSRWGIEELYKISKVLINVEEFPAQSERGIKQELFAHFVLITLHPCEATFWYITSSTNLEKTLSSFLTFFYVLYA